MIAAFFVEDLLGSTIELIRSSESVEPMAFSVNWAYSLFCQRIRLWTWLGERLPSASYLHQDSQHTSQSGTNVEHPVECDLVDLPFLVFNSNVNSRLRRVHRLSDLSVIFRGVVHVGDGGELHHLDNQLLQANDGPALIIANLTPSFGSTEPKIGGRVKVGLVFLLLGDSFHHSYLWLQKAPCEPVDYWWVPVRCSPPGRCRDLLSRIRLNTFCARGRLCDRNR